MFDMNANSTIYFDDSYCCIAINEVKIIQHTGKEAIVYDKNNNKIFDGTGLGEGVFHLRCSFEPLTSLSVTLQDETVKTLSAGSLKMLYTGDNEVWTVTKETLIT